MKLFEIDPQSFDSNFNGKKLFVENQYIIRLKKLN